MAVFAANKTAFITGGASGIGLAVARLCHKHGMKLAIADYDTENLTKAKTEFNSPNIETYQLDVSQLDQWKTLKPKIESQLGGRIDLLMLNAGTSGTADWSSNDYFRKVLDTNLYGVINGLNTFLPLIKDQSSPSSIVITGSKQGITNPPGNPAYNASKAAVKVLAEHLSYDLRDSNTSVHLLVPGWTFTGLAGAKHFKEKPAGAWEPAQVADFLKGKMEEGKFYVICPDNEVTEDKDKRRMLWSVGDVVNGRPPLSRWREEFKEEAERWMAEQNLES